MILLPFIFKEISPIQLKIARKRINLVYSG